MISIESKGLRYLGLQTQLPDMVFFFLKKIIVRTLVFACVDGASISLELEIQTVVISHVDAGN